MSLSQDSEIIPGKKAAILRAKSEIEGNPYYYFTELYSSQEKQYIKRKKEKLIDEVSSLKAQVSDLESKNKSKKQYVSKGELFELKYQIIDSFYTKNIQSYIDMIYSYNQIRSDNIILQKKIIFYEENIENQFELRKSIIEESDQMKYLLDFSDSTNITYPELTDIQGYNFTKINIEGIEKENENSSSNSDDSFQNKRPKIHFDFLIHKVHEQISWSENRLRQLRNEINKFDMLLDTYHESQKRDAANTISTAQQIFSKKNQIGAETLKITINDLQKEWESSEKLVNDLEHQNEELRQKKVKNDLNYANEKARLKMLRSASLECYKKQLSEMKNKAKHLRRLINTKADEYDFNCELLLNVFNEFDEKINGQSEKVKKNWTNNQAEKEPEKKENEDNEEEEEEVIEEVYIEDPSQSALMNELSKKRNEIEYDIKVLKKQLKKMICVAKNKNNAFISRIGHLQNKEKRNQMQIQNELLKMQKLPQNKSYKYIDKIDASMLKLGQILENS